MKNTLTVAELDALVKYRDGGCFEGFHEWLQTLELDADDDAEVVYEAIDDNHAGWLERLANDLFGDSSSIGEVFQDHLNHELKLRKFACPCGCGKTYRVGDAEAGRRVMPWLMVKPLLVIAYEQMPVDAKVPGSVKLEVDEARTVTQLLRNAQKEHADDAAWDYLKVKREYEEMEEDDLKRQVYNLITNQDMTVDEAALVAAEVAFRLYASH